MALRKNILLCLLATMPAALSAQLYVGSGTVLRQGKTSWMTLNNTDLVCDGTIQSDSVAGLSFSGGANSSIGGAGAIALDRVLL
ncbi:MAG: hypothetical protein JST39_22980, partial [Bacteroidetes bacterium]|nr:hypothetical protein [Bacteroidota bacterium]